MFVKSIYFILIRIFTLLLVSLSLSCVNNVKQSCPLIVMQIYLPEFKWYKLWLTQFYHHNTQSYFLQFKTFKTS